MGDEKLVSLQDKDWEIRFTVRTTGDIACLDVMQKEILESLEDQHFTLNNQSVH